MDNVSVDATLNNARRLLRAHRLGRLVATLPDGLETRAEDCHFVIDGDSGSLVFTVTRIMLEFDGHAIFIPDECARASGEILELGVSLTHEQPVPEVLRDRHLAYHGHIRGGVWVQSAIEWARLNDTVIDGEEMRMHNRLALDEAALCRLCNASADRLVRAACERFGVVGSQILAVGVDDFGIDLRVGHRVRRVEFTQQASTRDEAVTEIESFLLLGDRS